MKKLLFFAFLLQSVGAFGFDDDAFLQTFNQGACMIVSYVKDTLEKRKERPQVQSVITVPIQDIFNQKKQNEEKNEGAAQQNEKSEPEEPVVLPTSAPNVSVEQVVNEVVRPPLTPRQSAIIWAKKNCIPLGIVGAVGVVTIVFLVNKK
jgi:hypothetical protein